MARHILVPLDGSTRSWAAFDHAISNYDGETITTLSVVDPMEGVYSDYGGGGYYDEEVHARAVEKCEELGDRARERAAEAGVSPTTVVDSAVETGPPARMILEYAESNDVDHVVVGSHGRAGVSRLLLGSVAETVARRSPVPVTIVR